MHRGPPRPRAPRAEQAAEPSGRLLAALQDAADGAGGSGLPKGARAASEALAGEVCGTRAAGRPQGARPRADGTAAGPDAGSCTTEGSEESGRG